MYLFVFLWVPSLQEAAKRNELPLGYIFSSFMIAMMLGSILYTAIVTYSLPSSTTAPADSSLTLHAKLSSLVCAVSALCFAVSARSDSEEMRFWAFCVFEACVGMYYPVQGMLRGSLISNEHRATVRLNFMRCLYPADDSTLVALLAVSRSTQCLCRHIVANRSIGCAVCRSHGELDHASIFVRHDWIHCRASGG
jgi:hypothetical protein